MEAGEPEAVKTTVDPLQIFISLAVIVASGVIFPPMERVMALLVSGPQVVLDKMQVTISPSFNEEEEKLSPPVPIGVPFTIH